MIVYSCQNCKWLDIGEEGEEKNCMKCNSNMLSLGITTAEWNSYSDTQKDTVINNILENKECPKESNPPASNESLDSDNNEINPTPQDKSLHQQDDPQSQSSVVFLKTPSVSKCELDDYDFAIVDKVKYLYDRNDYSSMIKIITEYTKRGQANPYISLYLCLTNYKNKAIEALDETQTNIIKAIDFSIPVLVESDKISSFIIQAVAEFSKITASYKSTCVEKVTSLYEQAEQQVNAFAAEVLQNGSRMSARYISNYKNAALTEVNRISQETENEVSTYNGIINNLDLISMDIQIYAFNKLASLDYINNEVARGIKIIIEAWNNEYNGLKLANKLDSRSSLWAKKIQEVNNSGNRALKKILS